MTKQELMEHLSNQEVDILESKRGLQKLINKCFDENNIIIDPARYDDLKRGYEFYNGQQVLIRQQITLFKINAAKYYEMVEAKELASMRKAN